MNSTAEKITINSKELEDCCSTGSSGSQSLGPVREITPENISLLEDDINIVVFFPNKKPSHLAYLSEIQTHLNRILAKRKTYYDTLSDIKSLDQNSSPEKQNELAKLAAPLAPYFKNQDSENKIKIGYCLTSHFKNQTELAVASNLLRKFVIGKDFSTKINYQSAMSKFFTEEDEVIMPFKDTDKHEKIDHEDSSSSCGMGDGSEDVSFEKYCCCALSIKNKLKFVCEQFNDEMHTLDTIFQFGLELIEGEKKQFVKSERLPMTPNEKKDPIYGVYKVVSKNFEEIVFNSKKNVFLFTWTDWCPPCAMVFPQFYKMAYAMAEEKDFLFATFDSDKNDRIESFCLPESDLPLLKFFCSESPKQKNIHYLKNLTFKTLFEFFLENSVCLTEPINKERVLRRYKEAESIMNKKMVQLPLFGVPSSILNENGEKIEDIDEFLEKSEKFDFNSWMSQTEIDLSKEIAKLFNSDEKTKAVVVCFMAFFAPTSKRMEVFLGNISEKLNSFGIKFIKILLDDFLKIKKQFSEKIEIREKTEKANPFFIDVLNLTEFPTFKIFSKKNEENEEIICDSLVGALPGALGMKLKRIVESGK